MGAVQVCSQAYLDLTSAKLNVFLGGAKVIPPRSGRNVGTMSATSVEDLFQEVGREAVAIAGDDLAGRLLVYAEVEDRVSSADILYKNHQGDARLVLGARPFKELVYKLWEQWKAQPGNEEWRVMSYVVDQNGKLTIDLIYPDDVDSEEDVTDRRPRAVEKYFGDVKVIQPDPFA
jgi:hypothetical protein